MTDAAWLERQYRPWNDVQAMIDIQAILDNWAQMSESYLRRADIARDIPYGTLAGERLDLLRPSNTNAPVLVFIHGGYWQSLDKDDYAFALEPLVSAGALVATVNYTLCPEVTLDTLVGQVRAACAWVWRHARDYGGVPERLHVTGHSAGGHLTAMMATTDWPEFENGLPHDMIRSAIPVSGVFDLEPIRLSSLNDAVRMDQKTAKHNSPLFMKPTTTLPVSVVVGGQETDEFHRQSRELTNAWGSAAGAIEYIEIPGHHHLAVIEAMTEPNNLLTATILRHIGL